MLQRSRSLKKQTYQQKSVKKILNDCNDFSHLTNHENIEEQIVRNPQQKKYRYAFEDEVHQSYDKLNRVKNNQRYKKAQNFLTNSNKSFLTSSNKSEKIIKRQTSFSISKNRKDLLKEIMRKGVLPKILLKFKKNHFPRNASNCHSFEELERKRSYELTSVKKADELKIEQAKVDDFRKLTIMSQVISENTKKQIKIRIEKRKSNKTSLHQIK